MENTLPRTIKISKLPPNVTEEMIREALSISGNIESVDIQNSEALVIFANEESADSSQMLDNTFIGGCSITIEKAKAFEPKKEEPALEKKKEKEDPIFVKKEIFDEPIKEKEIPKDPKKDINKMMNAMNLVNVPAKSALPGEDLFSAVFNRRYGIVVVGLWSVYLVFFSVFSGSE
jgi:RNA recognition motif-containing protein